MNIERLIRDALDAWTMWRIERRLFRARPDFERRVAELRTARQKHRPTRKLLRAIRHNHGSSVWHRAQVVVAFRFPGMKIGPACFRMDDHHKIGPPTAGYTCCNGDREAFEAYCKDTKRRAA